MRQKDKVLIISYHKIKEKNFFFFQIEAIKISLLEKSFSKVNSSSKSKQAVLDKSLKTVDDSGMRLWGYLIPLGVVKKFITQLPHP